MSSETLQHLQGWRADASQPGGLANCALIVPTYRRPKEIIRLLNLLAELPDTPEEVVIVDGSPESDVNKMISDWARVQQVPFALCHISSPPGLTRQRNVGLDACNREFIFFLDDDCLPEPGYFWAIRQVFLEDATNTVGGVRGFITNGIETPMPMIWRLRYALGLVPRGEPWQYHSCGTSGSLSGMRPFGGTRRVDLLAGGASGYRREVFLKHRFSSFFYGYAQGEDFEMSLRIGKDWKLLACGDARVNHAHAESGRPSGFPRGRMAVRNRYFIWKRHSPQCPALDRLRFWLDHLLIIGYSLASFLARPTRAYSLCYAAGTLAGVLEVLGRPPRYDEPPARKQYEIDYVNLRDRSETQTPEVRAPKAEFQSAPIS